MSPPASSSPHHHDSDNDSDSNDHTPLLHLQRGTYQSPNPATDIRCACPILNTLANHGLIPRDGRSVRAPELSAAIRSLGISSTISTTLTNAVFLERHDDHDNNKKSNNKKKKNPWTTSLWSFLKSPFAFLFQRFAMRDPGQHDTGGHPCLSLNQLNRPGVIEHDVSMTRRDFAQGDNHSLQADLVASLLASSSDGRVLTTADLARFRRQRTQQARRENPVLEFGDAQNMMACAEAAFVQRVFGNKGKGTRGWEVPVAYLRAVFAEERLPVEEGWRRREGWWWRLGFGELVWQARTLKREVDALEVR